MLTILCAFLLDIALIIVLVNLKFKSKRIWRIITTIFAVAVFAALFAPIKGYERKEFVKEFEIGPYVQQDIFSFTYIGVSYSVILNDDEEPVKKYSKVTIPLTRAKVIFEDEGKSPYIRVYKKYMVRDIWWAFAVVDEVTEYEVHIPINLTE